MKIKNNKRKSRVLLIVWVVLLLVLPFSVSSLGPDSDGSNVSYLSSDLEIQGYHVELDVDANAKIDVTETVTVMISDDGMHGIYRSIPIWQSYYDSQGKARSKRVLITNLRAIGEKFTLDEPHDRVGIRIGSARTEASRGLHTYTIKYRYDMGKDRNPGFDQMVFHVFDNFGGAKVGSLSVAVHMPEGFGPDGIRFLKDAEDVSGSVRFRLDGSTLAFELDSQTQLDSQTLDSGSVNV
jgi:hypothetical protein